MKQPRRFETRAVHSGEHRAGAKEGRDEIFYPISTPIYASTTFSHPKIETTDRVLGGEEQGYSYARYDNPTVRAFEEALGSLEDDRNGTRALAFGSARGEAALAAVPRGEPLLVRADAALPASDLAHLLVTPTNAPAADRQRPVPAPAGPEFQTP